jgi:hypothetical protein
MTNQILSQMYKTVNVFAVARHLFAIHAAHPIGVFAGSGESDGFR